VGLNAHTPNVEQPFVGRETELELLRDALGRGRIVVLAGEPGIGKTRIAEEIAAEAAARGIPVGWGRCWEGDGAPAFWPWIPIIRDHVSHSDSDEVNRVIGSSTPEPHAVSSVDPAQARFRLFDGIAALLKRAAKEQGLVLLLDDLHWADDASLLLLQFLAPEIAATSVLVIATYRDVELSNKPVLAETLAALARHRHCVQLTLPGLREADVRRYVALTLGAHVGAELGNALVQRSEGNPFFLTELVRLLARERSATGVAETLPAGVPTGIREVIARRLRGHSERCNEILRAAAVLGREPSLAVLQEMRLASSADLLDAVGEAMAGRLLAETDTPGRFRFSHSLIRETLYEGLPLARRVELHRHVGEALEACHGTDGAHAAELAHHFAHAATDADGRRAVRHSIRAGTHATAVLAHEEAVAHYRQALAMLELWDPSDGVSRCEIMLGVGEALVRAGEPKAAEDAFLRAADLARGLERAEDLARAALGLGQIERFQDRLSSLLEEALAALGPDDSVLHARVLSRLAVALYWTRAEDRKTALSARAVDMARGLGHTPTLAYALSSRIATLSGPDDVEARLAAATEMVELGERCADRELAMVGRGWCIADRLALADIDQVRHGLDTFTRLADELRHPYFSWWSKAIGTMRALLEGRFADAERGAHDALQLGQRAVAADATQVFAGHLYVLAMEQERLGELEPVVRALGEQFPLVPGTHCALALLYADSGRVDEAAHELGIVASDDFQALPRNPEWLGMIAALAQTSALLPGAPHAERLYALLAPYTHRIIVSGLGVLCSGAVAHYLGLLATSLGRWQEARAHLDEALLLHAQIGSPPCLAYTRYEAARLARASTRPEDRTYADDLELAAVRTAETLGMRRLRRMLDQLADPTGRSRARGPVAGASASLPTSASGRVGVLRKEGDYWTLGLAGPEFRLKDSIGLHYLAALISHPGREFLAADLVTMHRLDRTRAWSADTPAANSRQGVPSGAGPLLDEQARRAYKRRLDDLREELEEARRYNDFARADAAQTEIEMLTGELARASGLGGRSRQAASPHERARVSATRAIQAAVRRIRANDHGLGRHLASTIRTGTFCSYSPDPGALVSWRL
jgi:tetratricopeptide (TPR) repeat protein